VIAELYASICGDTELWNRARLARYMGNGVNPKVSLACSPTPGLEELVPCIEDQAPAPDGYNLPELDPAPWYDPLAPESKDFAGLLVLETKLSPAIDRRLVQRVGHGAVLTRTRFAGRTLYVRGMLVGRTCCASTYGLRWLTQALLGNPCAGCSGYSLTFLTCEPSKMEGDCFTVYEGDTQVPYYRPDEDSEWENGLSFVRRMHDAGLLQGPEVVGRVGSDCGCGCAGLTEIEFTIGLGVPWLYRLPDQLVNEATLGGCSTDLCMVEFQAGGACDPIGGECPEPYDCAEDPNCVEIAPPLGATPLQQCGCVPLVVGRNCVSVPAGPARFEQALTVEISAGATDLRNVAVRAWDNEAGVDCCAPENSSVLQDCAADATLLVSHVPAGGVLRFDSERRQVTITCADGSTWPAGRNVSTAHGLPFDWLEAVCGATCVTIDIDCAHTAPDATVSVFSAGREL
jgi:hypothetical protein